MEAEDDTFRRQLCHAGDTYDAEGTFDVKYVSMQQVGSVPPCSCSIMLRDLLGEVPLGRKLWWVEE